MIQTLKSNPLVPDIASSRFRWLFTITIRSNNALEFGIRHLVLTYTAIVFKKSSKIHRLV